MNLMDTAEFLEIECPQCEAEYRIELKYCGETALCDNCKGLFKIPSIEELTNAHELNTSENTQQEEVSDKTVKIERKSIGMIPDAEAQNIIDTSNYIIPPNTTPKKKRRVFRL